MPKKRENPTQWMPPLSLPDILCTPLQLWSRYCWDIASYRGFCNVEDTVSEYTASLKRIEGALSKITLCHADVFCLWDAVISVRGRVNSSGDYIPYRPGSYAKRLTILHDIFSFAEARHICTDPFWFSPWELLGDLNKEIFELTSKDLQDMLGARITHKVLPRYLSAQQEQKLLRKILKHIKEDGRWLGLAILLFCGMRPSEARGLYFRAVKCFSSHPDRRYIRLYQSAEGNGDPKVHMKNRYAPRAIPEHIELLHVMALREEYIRECTGIDDLSALPVISYKNEFSRPCTASELAIFTKQQLLALFGREYMSDMAGLIHLESTAASEEVGENNFEIADYVADMEIAPRLLRRNFATKNYAETRLFDWQSRLTMGHETEAKTCAPYGESNLWEMLLAMDHRMILQEIHPGWHTKYHGGTYSVEVADSGVHYLTIEQGRISSLSKVIIEADVDTQGDDFLLELFRCFPVDRIKVEVQYRPVSANCQIPRVNSDAAHWPLDWRMVEKEKEKKDE